MYSELDIKQISISFQNRIYILMRSLRSGLLYPNADSGLECAVRLQYNVLWST